MKIVNEQKSSFHYIKIPCCLTIFTDYHNEWQSLGYEGITHREGYDNHEPDQRMLSLPGIYTTPEVYPYPTISEMIQTKTADQTYVFHTAEGGL